MKTNEEILVLDKMHRERIKLSDESKEPEKEGNWRNEKINSRLLIYENYIINQSLL